MTGDNYLSFIIDFLCVFMSCKYYAKANALPANTICKVRKFLAILSIKICFEARFESTAIDL